MSADENLHWDVIVIGSGMGGMAAAAALSKFGKKVLLLEQHHTLGGQTHSFSRKGFTWDVGLHYLSGVAPGDRARAHGLSTWVQDRDDRYQALQARLTALRGGPDPALDDPHPFDRQAFFSSAQGAGDSLFHSHPSVGQIDGCIGIIAAFEDLMPDGTLEQLAYILATAYHETGHRMQPVREGFAQSDDQAQTRLEAAWQAGRLPLVSAPYWRDGYFGRGLVQLTHKHNYAGPLRGGWSNAVSGLIS